MLFLELLKNWSSTDRIAAVDPAGKELSYKDLEERSEALATDWLENYPDGSPILICGDKENDLITCMFAGLKSNHPYIFVPDYYPVKRITEIYRYSEASCIVNLGKELPFDSWINVKRPDEIDRIAELKRGQKVDFVPATDDLACIFFTSGSTGVPKGVMLTVRNLESMEEWWTNATRAVEDRASVLNFSAYTFSASLVTIYSYMLRHGGTLHSVSREVSQDLPALIDLFFKVNPNCLDCTPSFLDLCMKSERFCHEHLPSLKLISLGGEPLTSRIGTEAMDRFPTTDIVNGYGCTEVSAGCLDIKVTRELLDTDGPLPIGYIAKGSEIYVVDDDDHPVPDGEIGELVIVSEMVGLGYFKDPKKTAEVFFMAPNGFRGYHTGDLVTKQPDGKTIYVGRKNNMVKIGGYRVEMEEVELNLNAVDLVRKSVVVPVYDQERAVMLNAFVILEENIKPGLSTTIQIKKKLSEKLSSYMIPSRIDYLEELPTNANGKLDRKSLIEKVRIK